MNCLNVYVLRWSIMDETWNGHRGAQRRIILGVWCWWLGFQCRWWNGSGILVQLKNRREQLGMMWCDVIWCDVIEIIKGRNNSQKGANPLPPSLFVSFSLPLCFFLPPSFLVSLLKKNMVKTDTNTKTYRTVIWDSHSIALHTMTELK